jgi:hypothetical protein
VSVDIKPTELNTRVISSCLERDDSKTGFCLCLQVEPTQLEPGDKRLARSIGPNGDGDKIQSPKCRVLNKRQEDGCQEL